MSDLGASENTTEKQSRRPFEAGVSGNPNGRPKGSRNKATLAAEALLEGETEALTRKCIELAQQGDTTALRLCMDRICPPRKGRAVTLDLPPIDTAGNVLAAFSEVVAAMSKGEITTDEAQQIAGVLELKRKALETVDLETRITALEKNLEKPK